MRRSSWSRRGWSGGIDHAVIPVLVTGSVVPHAPAPADGWIPGPSPGMTPSPVGEECMHTVFDFAAKRALLSPDAVAFEHADGGGRLTFAAFNERAERGAAALERMGFAAGERIAILCHNAPLFFEV